MASIVGCGDFKPSSPVAWNPHTGWSAPRSSRKCGLTSACPSLPWTRNSGVLVPCRRNGISRGIDRTLPPAAARSRRISAAIPATVAPPLGFASPTPNVSRNRVCSSATDSESPPSRKKSSLRPIGASFSICAKIPAIERSRSSRGGSISRSSLGSGRSIAASAFRSILPLAVSGSASRNTYPAGSM